MTIVMRTPSVPDLGEVIGVLREWQVDEIPVQLHPGDLGWYWRFGAEATAAAVRLWSRDRRVLAVGLLDGARLLRLAIAPEAERDDELAHQMVADVSQSERGVLPEGIVSIEARFGASFRELLTHAGWQADEPWTPLQRDLAAPAPDCDLRVEVIGPERADVRASVQRAAFDPSTFTEERWHTMARGPAYGDARCLVAYDGRDTAVAFATVWSAGRGRPGLLEPVGVHRDHRGQGYGRAITVAAAAILKELGSSSAIVCTASSNVGAVATYGSAGFRQLPDVQDLRRTA